MAPNYHLVQYVGRTRTGLAVGVLDTPCFPCRYFGGPVYGGRPLMNDTGLFHRTIEEAIKGAAVFLPQPQAVAAGER